MASFSRKKIATLLFALVLLFPVVTRAAVLKPTFPRLANYFLKWSVTDDEAQALSKWDVLILDMEVQENSPEQIKKIRELHPGIIILAYLTSEEILDNIGNYNGAYLRQKLAAKIDPSWWLKDASGHKISNWPDTFMLNLSDGAGKDSTGERFNDYLPEFVVNNLKSSGLWDGVFYDNTWGDISWINNHDLDLDNNGVVDNTAEADSLWASGFKKMLARTRQLAGPDFIIVGNGRVYDGYLPLINGMMLESFPSTWENGGTWSGSMKTYLKLPAFSVAPQVPVINIYDRNQANYRHMRFGLTSALLGEGFYSYDYDVTNHGQTWWYDEYNINLGPAQTPAFNLLDKTADDLKSGLWRRDFQNGIALVNSTDKKQTYLFTKENFEKIKGKQDAGVNNGRIINYVSLAPQDGLVLLRRNTSIKNSPFTNGYFYRIYNNSGEQAGNGFFSYVSAYSGDSEVIMASGTNDGEQAININAAAGQVNLFKNGKKIIAFSPFGKNFKNPLSLSAQLDDGYFKKVVVGAGPGGGPQVIVAAPNGKIEKSFFAYDKKLRSGVNVALADIDDDGQLEIITSPGKGAEPLIKIFSLSGNLKSSFLAFDAKFKGGVNLATGDINDDGQAEILASPASSGGPQIRIFNSAGKSVGSFFAYDKSYHGGIKVSVNDINNDGRNEILVGLKNFY